MISELLIIMAMEAEAEPLLEMLGATEVDVSSNLPLRRYDASVGGLSVGVAVNGVDPRFGVDSIGTVAAALTAHEAIRARRPDLVMSAGTAGGWARQDTEIGDVFVAWDRFVFHDRRIALPGFDTYGRADLPAADIRSVAEICGAKTGIVTTSDALDESDDDRERILASGASVKEMEAAAVARVCDLHGVPMTAVKAITDLVDDPAPTEEQFVSNLHTASQRLREVLADLLPHLDGYVL